MSLAPTRPQKSNFDLLSCGFVSGILQSILFNPWDKALYLSIKVSKSLIDSIFIFPYHIIRNDHSWSAPS